MNKFMNPNIDATERLIGAARMLVHINGQFTMWNLKLSL
jgi:hypothetical protein